MLQFQTKYFAHRGLHSGDGAVPENSLSAFRQAVFQGYGIELDLQLTADERVVVFHDDTLARMCGEQGSVHDYTYEELCSFSLLDSEEKIPLFQEVLALVDSRVPLIVELKDVPQKRLLAEHVMSFLDSYDGEYCIESFHPYYLMWLKEHRPWVKRGQLAEDFIKYNDSLPTVQKRILRSMTSNFLTKPDFVAVDFRSRHMNTFRFWKKYATPVAWTIRTEKELVIAKKYYEYFIFENIRP